MAALWIWLFVVLVVAPCRCDRQVAPGADPARVESLDFVQQKMPGCDCQAEGIAQKWPLCTQGVAAQHDAGHPSSSLAERVWGQDPCCCICDVC